MSWSARYTVYREKDDFPVMIDGTAEECARAMGISPKSFHAIASRSRNGKIAKWHIDTEYIGCKRKAKKISEKSRRKNLEKYQREQAEFREAHREEIRAYRKRYDSEHKAEISAKRSRYYQEHKEEENARNAAYKKANPDKVKKWAETSRRRRLGVEV